MAARGSLLVGSAKAVIAALVATLAVYAVSLLLPIDPAFPPLAGPGPTIFFTLVFTLMAIGVYALVARFSSDPDRTFVRIAVVALVVSFAPDFFLLTEAAAEQFPGASPLAAGVLMLQHVVAALAIVWGVTGSAARGGGAGD